MKRYRKSQWKDRSLLLRGFRYPCLLALPFVLCLSGMLTSCREEPAPPSPDDTGLFAACIIPGTQSSLDIVTFNVEGFPKAGYTSITALAALLKTMDPDVVALQEVASKADFDRLVKLMPGWKGYLNPTNNDEWNLAYLLKSSEIEMISSSEILLFKDDIGAFPRAPYEIKIKHTPSGKDIYLINIHLKCCSGIENENSRKSASEKLKNYLDITRPGDRVIVLGDFNDEISASTESENPFLNFVKDPAGYSFADMAIAKGSPLWWSYPGFPSHIDHILISNELVPSIDTCMVVKVAPCYPDYSLHLSDHRPVELILKY
jgi:endonuclease/exonuclease/phosphatase family metal-dependent hydrolase